MARVIFLDKLIRSIQGHNLEYCLRIAPGFENRGYERIILANRYFKGERILGLIPCIDFDYEKAVLGASLREMRKAKAERLKAERKARFDARLRSSSLREARLAIREFQEGRFNLNSAPSLASAAVAFAVLSLASRLMLGVFWAVFWPFRAFWRGMQALSRGLRRGDLRHWLSVRVDELRKRIRLEETARLGLAFLRVRAGNDRDAAISNSIIAALSRLKVNENDIILCTTTVPADLAIYQTVISSLPDAKKPIWNFVFREPVFLNEGRTFFVGEAQRLLRTRLVNFKERLKIRTGWWVDTDELAEQYDALGVFSFGVLPVAVPPELSALARPREREGALVIGYVGDARPEKGYADLPRLMSELNARKATWLARLTSRHLLDYKLTRRDDAPTPRLESAQETSIEFQRDKIRQRRLAAAVDRINPDRLDGAPTFELFAQSNFNIPDGTPVTRPARYRLISQSDIRSKLEMNAMSSQAYLEAIDGIDIVYANYQHRLYHAGSSGVFAEGLTAGRPILVSDDTWGGRRLRSSKAFVEHVRKLSDHQSSRQLPIPSRFGDEGLRPHVLLPRSNRLIITQASFADRYPSDQVALRFDFTNQQGISRQRRRLLSSRIQRASAAILVPHDAISVRISLDRLNARMAPEDIQIEVFARDFDPAKEAIGAIGLVVSHHDEITDAILNIGRHYHHYQSTALAFAAEWQAENSADLVAARLTHHFHESV